MFYLRTHRDIILEKKINRREQKSRYSTNTGVFVFLGKKAVGFN